MRNLHFVLKIADRTETAKFFRQTLGMQVLRHEEVGCRWRQHTHTCACRC